MAFSVLTTCLYDSIVKSRREVVCPSRTNPIRLWRRKQNYSQTGKKQENINMGRQKLNKEIIQINERTEMVKSR